MALGSATTAVGIGLQMASSEWKLFMGGRIVTG